MRFHRCGDTDPRPDQASRSAESNGDQHASHPNPHQATRQAVDGTDRASAWPCMTANEDWEAYPGMRASPRRLRRVTGSRAGRSQPGRTSRVDRRDAARRRPVWRPPPCRTRTREREVRSPPPAVPCIPLRSRRSQGVRPKCSRTGSHRRAPGGGGRPRLAGRPTPLRTVHRRTSVRAGGARGRSPRRESPGEDATNSQGWEGWRTRSVILAKAVPRTQRRVTNSWTCLLRLLGRDYGSTYRHGMTGAEARPQAISQRFRVERCGRHSSVLVGRGLHGSRTAYRLSVLDWGEPSSRRRVVLGALIGSHRPPR